MAANRTLGRHQVNIQARCRRVRALLIAMPHEDKVHILCADLLNDIMVAINEVMTKNRILLEDANPILSAEVHVLLPHFFMTYGYTHLLPKMFAFAKGCVVICAIFGNHTLLPPTLYILATWLKSSGQRYRAEGFLQLALQVADVLFILSKGKKKGGECPLVCARRTMSGRSITSWQITRLKLPILHHSQTLHVQTAAQKA